MASCILTLGKGCFADSVPFWQKSLQFTSSLSLHVCKFAGEGRVLDVEMRQGSSLQTSAHMIVQLVRSHFVHMPCDPCSTALEKVHSDWIALAFPNCWKCTHLRPCRLIQGCPTSLTGLCILQPWTPPHLMTAEATAVLSWCRGPLKRSLGDHLWSGHLCLLVFFSIEVLYIASRYPKCLNNKNVNYKL